ncbi:DUF58 domain-containing protein [Flavihumibacter sp. R14]|nr:DUF58 domain-containing protein [Flavihumibacter soli]
MAIKDLSLAAKTIIDGFMTGINKSSIKGPGMEFSQYRSYQPGDDLRWLDWKMYGRSDRYYIRESEMETNISVRLLIDASGSMNHEDSGIKKIDYARYMAAALAYLAHLQSDAVGLYIFRDGDLVSLTAKQDFQHLSRLFYHLENLQATGNFTSANHFNDIYTRSQKRELLIFITDFYQQDEEIIKLLDTMVALKNEVVVFHLMGKNELEMDFKGYSTLEDLETGETVQFNSSVKERLYQEKLENYLAQVRTQLLERNIAYKLIRTDEPLDQALREFLKQRSNIKL